MLTAAQRQSAHRCSEPVQFSGAAMAAGTAERRDRALPSADHARGANRIPHRAMSDTLRGGLTGTARGR